MSQVFVICKQNHDKAGQSEQNQVYQSPLGYILLTPVPRYAAAAGQHGDCDANPLAAAFWESSECLGPNDPFAEGWL